MLAAKTAYSSTGILSPRSGNIEFGSFLYYAAFTIYVIASGVGSTSWSLSGLAFAAKLVPILKLIALALFALKVALFQSMTLRQWGVALAIVLLGCVSYYVATDSKMPELALIIVAAKGIKLKPIARIVLVLNIVLLVIVVLGSWTGVLADYVLSRSSGRVRHSIGFAHPNGFGVCISTICLATLALRSNRMRIFDILFGVFCCFVIDWVSDSRTAEISLILAVMMFYLNARITSPRFRYFYYKALAILAFVLVGGSLILMVIFNPLNHYLVILDSYLSSRLYWANFYFENYLPGLFGQNTHLLPPVYYDGFGDPSTFVVDNAYARLYLRFGPIMAFVMLLAIVLFLWRAPTTRQENVVFIGFVAAVVYGAAEAVFLNPEFNFFMVIGFSWLLYNAPELGFRKEKCEQDKGDAAKTGVARSKF